MGTWDDLAEERRATADLLEGLTPEQWGVQTLCPAWDVHAMAAHLTVPCTFTAGELVTTLARARGNVDRAALRMVERRAAQSPAELIAVLRERAEVRKAPPIVGVMGPYTDALIHLHDMLIPLGMRDSRPADRWRPSLDFLVSARARVGFRTAALPDVQLVATDIDWSHGDGPVVEAPAPALAMAMTRRTARLYELSGPGAEVLREWSA